MLHFDIKTIGAMMNNLKIEKIENELVVERDDKRQSKIKVIGIGNSGVNAINHMISMGSISNIDFIVANTDYQSLDSSPAQYKIQLGTNTTKGLGAGMNPDVGRESAIESSEDIKEILRGADIVLIVAGLGARTGTGATPIVAQIAKELNALTVSIVTRPLKFEGRKRTQLANKSMVETKQKSDSIVEISSNILLAMPENKIGGLKETFEFMDDILMHAVHTISNIITFQEDKHTFFDISAKTILSDGGLALMGIGHAWGIINSASFAAKLAIESPLLDGISIDEAMGILVHFDIHPNYPLIEIDEAMNIIKQNVDKDADMVFETTTNNTMDIDEVRITIIATSFRNQI